MIDAIRGLLRSEIERVCDVPYVLEVRSMPVMDSEAGLWRGAPQPQECRDLISGETFQYTFQAPRSAGSIVSAVSRNGRIYELYSYAPVQQVVYLDRDAQRFAEIEVANRGAARERFDARQREAVDRSRRRFGLEK